MNSRASFLAWAIEYKVVMSIYLLTSIQLRGVIVGMAEDVIWVRGDDRAELMMVTLANITSFVPR